MPSTTMRLTSALFLLLATFTGLFSIQTHGTQQRGLQRVKPSTQGQPANEVGVALVIGNSSYAFGTLRNPVNDAKLMASTLTKLGFHVMTPLLNGTREQMIRTLIAFGDALEKRGGNSIGVFYYSGHGAQVDGENYLIPSDAILHSNRDLKITAVSAAGVFTEMKRVKNRLNFVILDACRNVPFSRRLGSGTGGLSEMYAPEGTLIAFSTSPGEVAEDGEGGNSPYTQALTDRLLQPNVMVERMFRQVRNCVKQATGDQQIPWESSSLTGEDYFFNPGVVTPPGNSTCGGGSPPVGGGANQNGSEDMTVYLDFLTRPADGGEFHRFTDGDTLHSGDLYKIVLRPDQDGYVYIFQVDSSGHIQRIFPMASYGKLRLNNLNPVRRGVTYFLPAEKKAFRLDRKRGKESIYMFSSRQPRPDIEDLSVKLMRAPTTVASAPGSAKEAEAAKQKLATLFKSRDLPLEPMIAHTGGPSYRFVQDGETIEGVAGYLRNTCRTCVYVLEFRHE
ncbi:MAG: caspase family protein [Gammaproteobacteria bacterium]|nr:caspase family protein [Gammaproteobacteria bacterium]